MRRLLGFIVNPLAGIGGPLGFKGSDGAYAIRALMMGARLVSPGRAEAFIDAFSSEARSRGLEVEVLAPPGLMGYDEASRALGVLDVTEVPCTPRGVWPTTAHDTRRCAGQMEKAGVDLLVFVGGDGTARDIYESVDKRLPVLGVPAGVKVYSAVFAVNPVEAARVAADYLEGRRGLEERPVVDIDEDEYRRGRLVLRLYGYMLVPGGEGMVPSTKTVSSHSGVEDIVEFFAEEIAEPCTLLVLGPGETVARIAERLGEPKTLLGVDVYHNGKAVARDVDEETLYRLVRGHRERGGRVLVVVSPIGGQGFIFGRGNQQISPRVLRLVGRENIVVVATEDKLASLDALRVDTGDPEVDRMLRGYVRVLTGYGRWRLVKVV